MHVRVCMYNMSVHIIIVSIHIELLPCGEISMAVFYWDGFAEMCSKGSGILRCSEIICNFSYVGMVLCCFASPPTPGQSPN